MTPLDVKHKLADWIEEYRLITQVHIPEGIVDFLYRRMDEAALLPEEKDWVTIYRDGKTEKVRIISQDGPQITYSKANGTIGICSVDIMKKWTQGGGASLVRAIDHAKGDSEAVPIRDIGN